MQQKELKNIMDYDAATGNLIWKECKADWIKPGRVVGSERADGYKETAIAQERYLVHRLVFLWHHGYLPDLVDHIDQNPRNNKIDNLRAADKSSNAYNSKLNKRNKSGVRGVSWDKTRQRWVARFKKDGKYLCLGYFDTVEEAAAVRASHEQGGSKDV